MEEGDILFAHKALLLIPGLSDAARRVAGAILSHFNMKTGQCDPSVDRLACMLGIDRATVMKATKKLHDENLITRTKHGGSFHRTAYEPNFALFNSLVAEWDDRMKTGGAPPDPCRCAGTPADTPEPNVAKRQPSQSPNGDFDSRQMATQTLRINSSNKLFEDTPTGAREENRQPSVIADTKQGLWNGQAVLLSAAREDRAKVVVKVSSQFVAAERAKARWGGDLMALGPRAYAEAIDHIDEQMMEAATNAEIKRRGAGLRLLMDRLGAKMLMTNGGRLN